jgi:hypothetical protein
LEEKFAEHFIKKFMLYSVKGIFCVNFSYHSFFFDCHAGVDCFLDQDYVVSNLSFSHEAPLIGEDNSWEKVIYPGGINFGKDFVGGIIERDGEKAIKGV